MTELDPVSFLKDSLNLPYRLTVRIGDESASDFTTIPRLRLHVVVDLLS